VKSSPSNGNSASNNNGGGGGRGGDISDNADQGGGAGPGRGGGGDGERGRRASGVLLGDGVVKGSVGLVGEGKVSWHKNFCMPGITLCFKVV
jgi:hypothetical protein